MNILKLLSNPFEDIPERKLLLFGVGSFVFGTGSAFLLGGSYPGIMSFKSNSATLLQLISQNVINTLLLSIVLFLLGKFLNPKTRFQDMLITVMIARTALYAMALLNTKKWLNPISEHIAQNVANTQSGLQVSKMDLFLLFVGVLMILLLVIYFFYLIIKGFRIAVNSKSPYHGILVFVVMFVLEALSSTFIPYYSSW